MKSYRVIGTLGILTLLLAMTAVFSPAPFAPSHTTGFGSANDYSHAALNDIQQGLVINSAGSVALNASRLHALSLSAIVPQSADAAGLGEGGWAIAVILTVSSRETGSHSQLRAPPVFFLS